MIHNNIPSESVWSTIKRDLSPPPFGDPEKTKSLTYLSVFLWLLMVMNCFAVVFLAISFSELQTYLPAFLIISLILNIVLIWMLVRYLYAGKTQQDASILANNQAEIKQICTT